MSVSLKDECKAMNNFFRLLSHGNTYHPWDLTSTDSFENPPLCPHCNGNYRYFRWCALYMCESCLLSSNDRNTTSYGPLRRSKRATYAMQYHHRIWPDSNLLNNSPAEYSSSDTSYPAWFELDRTSSLDPFPQAHRSTDQWMKMGGTVLGTSPSAGYANSNRLNNSPAEFSSSDTSYPAWFELGRTSSLDPFPQAHRSTDQWMKVGGTVLGTSPSAGYANSNRLNNSPAEYPSSAPSSRAWFALNGGAITTRAVCFDVIHGDGTATMDPFPQAHRLRDQWMKVGETVLGTSPSAGYASSYTQAQFPFVGGASVCIDIGSNLNYVNGDGTATMDPILQTRLLTDQWVKLAEIVLGISAAAGYGSSTHFPKFANAAGFIASLTAISLRSKWQAATRVLAKFGAIACAAGTLAAIGKDLPEEYKWIGTVVFLIPAIAVSFA